MDMGSSDITEDDSTSWPTRLRWAVMLIIAAEIEKFKKKINSNITAALERQKKSSM